MDAAHPLVQSTWRHEERRERLARLLIDFLHLSRSRLIRERERYLRARAGQLRHPFPPEYLNDVIDALNELIGEKFRDDLATKRKLRQHYQKQSLPDFE